VRNALIVGASRGLGLSLTKALLQRELKVLALYRELSSELASLAEAAAGRLETHPLDVRRSEDFERVAAALDASRRFDLFIYNAAVHLEHERVDVELANVDDVLETLDVNAVGAIRAVRHLGRFIAKSGLVVLVSSEAGSLADNWRPSEYGYCMSKAALNMFARLLTVREHDRASGVQVIAMHPGWLRTDMGGPNADLTADEAARDILKTLSDRHGSKGPGFVDRFGKAMAW
jgi:NAD(P)-dependent dehydrogenase (short-subunit alcohol dehydrogenase family)